MDRDWHTRSHTLSQPQQRPKDSQMGAQRPLTIWWWRSEMDGWGGRDPRCFLAERRKNASQPSGYWPPVGPGLRSEAEPLGPPAPSPCTDSPPSSLWGTALAGSHQEALPPSCSHSAIALISENSEECSSDGITWNCSFSGKTKHTKVFCVRYWAGWVKLCVGVFFFLFVSLLFCLDFVFVF